MNLTSLQTHGLRLIMSIVKSSDGEPVQAPIIAEKENLKVGYVGKILFMLRHAGLIKTVRGRKGGYTEEDPSDAKDLYGRTKHLGEVQYPHCITLRTSIIGHELKGKRGLVEWFLSEE